MRESWKNTKVLAIALKKYFWGCYKFEDISNLTTKHVYNFIRDKNDPAAHYLSRIQNNCYLTKNLMVVVFEMNSFKRILGHHGIIQFSVIEYFQFFFINCA